MQAMEFQACFYWYNMAQWIRPLWAASDEYKYIFHSPLTVRNSLCTQLTLCRNREDALDCYLPDLFFTLLPLFKFKWIFQYLGYGGIAVLKVSTTGVSKICLAAWPANI